MENIRLGISQSRGYENASLEVKTISSREVAEMMEEEHWQVLRKLEGTKDGKTKGIISVLADHKIVVSEYFIPSTYKAEGNNKTYKEYLVTRKGCDMLANKMTSEKGVVFTAKYIERFYQMDDHIKQQQAQVVNSPMDVLRLMFSALEEQKQDIVEVKDDFRNFKEEMPIFKAQRKEISKRVGALGVKLLGGKKSPAYQDKSLRTRVYSDINGQIHREFGVGSCDEIKSKDYSSVFNVIHNYSLPMHLSNDIDYMNSQMSLGI